MEISSVYYSNGSHEDFKILYNNNKHILVKNLSTKSDNKYSFGLREDLYSFYGFPVNQSCLTKKEVIKTLNRFIEINKQYTNNKNEIKMYKDMIKNAKKECD